MRKLISTSFASPISPPSQANLLKTRAVILPKPATPLSLGHTSSAINVIELRKVNEPNLQVQRLPSQIDHSDTNEPKQRTICTPIIELKPITSGSLVITQNIHSLTQDSLTREVNKETTTERNELPSVS